MIEKFRTQYKSISNRLALDVAMMILVNARTLPLPYPFQQ